MSVRSSNIKNFIRVNYVSFENLLTKKWWPGIYIHVTENYQRHKFFSPLTGKHVSWKLRHNKKYFEVRTLLIYQKGVEHRKYVEYQKSKSKNVNKQWQKLSNIVCKYWVRLREEEAQNCKSNIIYFGAMFFEVRDRIFLRVIVFKAP